MRPGFVPIGLPSRHRLGSSNKDNGSGESTSQENIPTSNRQRLRSILTRLTRNNDRPSEREWRMFRRICKSRSRHGECGDIFRYFRKVLLPLAFPHSPHTKKLWKDIAVTGLSKSRSSLGSRLLTKLYQIYQFGDDSCVLGGKYIVVSDGITKDDDSDFFSRQVVNFLNVGLQRIDIKQDIGDEMYRLISSLEKLIIEVKLPAAATLSVALLSGNNLYVAALGDSEVKVIRSSEVIYSSPCQRSKNVPGQLNAYRSCANDMSFDMIKVKRGDFVVMASDGLWDNVFSSEAASMVKKNAKGSIAKLMHKALKRKREGRRYCRTNRKTGRTRCVGGRRDDITIIVAQI